MTIDLALLAAATVCSAVAAYVATVAARQPPARVLVPELVQAPCVDAWQPFPELAGGGRPVDG